MVEKLKNIFRVDTRATFSLARPLIESTSKTLLGVATFAFAGSLTFLGLRQDGVERVSLLKWAWALLGASVLLHLFVHITLLMALLAHGRVETHKSNASRLREAEADAVKRFDQARSGFNELAFDEMRAGVQNEGMFKRSSGWLITMLVVQCLAVVSGGVLMVLFVLSNL